ncbi:hypothetical protein TVAG_070300 [Trichomonas vaginalis G3]|uniref:Uncharacterized protein n=1 Tax=Trichomonas vaginalis (strain ATCC PRA-98 / G3) TaxID=412133 RepID=A2D7T4_TRIV3|nr:hypothetical protein TVAGG3_1044720 [Trichomonas vaginalis G3]EAY23367.1 hypothetical protein TVAG_070300 [Trichomonas vaginalis G3]KAI5493782.1 hypothetical protein TVAGG3_1044720 [Trichomonas vaginalis G3]|eukprot:XP_001584353.1 hypothetical protein [Trichomonas vaginalis G3]
MRSLFLFFSSALSCDYSIETSDILQSYRLDIAPSKKYCINLIKNQTYLLFTSGKYADVSITYYDYNKKHFTTESNRITELNSFAYFTLYYPTNFTIQSNVPDTIEFISVKYSTPCYEGFFFSSSDSFSVSFRANGVSPYQLNNYDNKCILIYGSENTTINVATSVEEHDVLTIYTNSNNRSLVGVNNINIYNESVALHFQSDFSMLSEYINVTKISNASKSNLATNGSLFIPKSWIKPDSKTNTLQPDTYKVSPALIITISVVSCLVAATTVFLLVYCLVCAKKQIDQATPQDGSILDTKVDDDLGQNLV